MLVLHVNNTHTWLCPARFILLIVRIVGHRSGFLFASCKQIEVMHDYSNASTRVRAASKLNVKEGMTKSSSIHDTIFCMTTVLRREERIWMHFWRNTPCFLTQLAKRVPDEMRKSARHKTYGSCSRREKRNSTIMKLLEISTEHADTLYLVPKWNCLCVNNRENSSLFSSLIGGTRNDSFKLLHH